MTPTATAGSNNGLQREITTVVLVLCLVFGSPISSAVAAGARQGSVRVSATPKWGSVEPGRWTPYSIRIANDSSADVEGEVLLIPQPEPAARAGARPTTAAPVEDVTGTTILTLGGRAMTTPPPRGPAATAVRPRWPTYRTPVAVPAATQKMLTIMVVEAQFGHAIEVHDRARGHIAGAPGPVPRSTERARLLLLSDIAGAGAALEAMPQQLDTRLEVSQLPSARAFPDNPLHLAGLHGVVIDDFDTATLTERQRSALGDYVSLGGALVLASGAAWRRTTGALPPGLVPLRATGSSVLPLASLADLVAVTTGATAPVATGELAAGQVVLGPSETPLVVVSEYGAGTVVQLAYDPLDEAIASNEVLRGPAFEQGVRRVADRWGGFGGGSTPADVPEDQIWAPVLDARPWPGWTGWGLGALMFYGLAAGPLACRVSRRRAGPLWAAVGALAFLATGLSLLASNMRPVTSIETVVEVRSIGADGAVLVISYRGALALDSNEYALAPGQAASSLLTASPLFRSPGGQVDPLGPHQQSQPVRRGFGGGQIRTDLNELALLLPARPWQLRTAETLFVHNAGREHALDATVRLTGSSGTLPGRLQGTVTNRGSSPLNQVRAQIPGAQARLADSLAPGETTRVDAPFVPVSGGNARLPRFPRQERVMFAAASRTFTAPGQIALAALADTSDGGKEGGSRVSVVTKVVTLHAADHIPFGSGGGRAVTTFTTDDGGSIIVFDMKVPPAAGPLSVSYRASMDLPGLPRLRGIEIYNWATKHWRELPTQPLLTFPYIEAPIEDGEVSDGLVRVRQRYDLPVRFVLPPHVLLTGDSTGAQGLG